MTKQTIEVTTRDDGAIIIEDNKNNYDAFVQTETYDFSDEDVYDDIYEDFTNFFQHPQNRTVMSNKYIIKDV